MFFEESHSTVGAMRVSSSTGDVGWETRETENSGHKT